MRLVSRPGRLPLHSALLALAWVFLDVPHTHAGLGIEMGFGVQSAWTDDVFLQNPDGWGLSLAKRLSRKTALQLSFSDLSHTRLYRGDLQFGFERYDSSLQDLLLESDAGARYYEFTFHHAVATGGTIRLDVGAGLGIAQMHLYIAGVNSDLARAFSDEGLIYTVSTSVTVNRLFNTPLALRVGYQYRTDIMNVVATTDNPDPTGDQSLSSVHLGLLAVF